MFVWLSASNLLFHIGILAISHNGDFLFTSFKDIYQVGQATNELLSVKLFWELAFFFCKSDKSSLERDGWQRLRWLK